MTTDIPTQPLDRCTCVQYLDPASGTRPQKKSVTSPASRHDSAERVYSLLAGSSAPSTLRPSCARMLYVATALDVAAGSIAMPRASSAARSAGGTCCMCLPQPSTSSSACSIRA